MGESVCHVWSSVILVNKITQTKNEKTTMRKKVITKEVKEEEEEE